MSSGKNTRVRGIYSTAITGVLVDAGWNIVQPSAAIRERFAESFSFDTSAVEIVMSSDREGVLVTGTREAVSAVSETLAAVGVDSMQWEAGIGRAAIREGTVIDTVGGGAVVSCEESEVFLPFDQADTYIEDGDTVTVQVHDPSPPWSDRRSIGSTGRRIFGGLAHLERADGKPRADVSSEDDANALIRETDVLPVAVPDGWRVRWQPTAIDVGMQAKAAALKELCGRIPAYEQPAPVTPETSVWVWFGRKSRMALDNVRGCYVPTIPGHHRLKASGEMVGKAVDFVEQLEQQPDTFPIETVFRVFGPAVGDPYRIDHGKPSGNRFPLGEGTVVDITGDTVTVRREMTAGGEYDGLSVPREAGDVAITNFKEGRWWYPTVYRDEEQTVKGTYVNVCTPVELFPSRALYLDLHVDVVRYPDGTTARLDDDELDAAEDAGLVSHSLAEKARSVADAVQAGLEE